MNPKPAIRIARANLSHSDPAVRCHADWYLEYKRVRTLRSLRCDSNETLRHYAARELAALRSALSTRNVKHSA